MIAEASPRTVEEVVRGREAHRAALYAICRCKVAPQVPLAFRHSRSRYDWLRAWTLCDGRDEELADSRPRLPAFPSEFRSGRRELEIRRRSFAALLERRRRRRRDRAWGR